MKFGSSALLRSLSLLTCLLLFLSAQTVHGESLVPLELGMPFAVIYSDSKDTVDVYKTDETEETNDNKPKSEVIDVLPDGYIVQILAVYGSMCRVYYFDEQNQHHIGYVLTSSVHQLTIAGLLSIMSEPQTAAYMQQFIGQSMPYVSGNPILLRSETAADPDEPTYVVNKNTKRIHLPSCGSINDIKSGNFEPYDGTLEEAVEKGYKPCKRCLADWYDE